MFVREPLVFHSWRLSDGGTTLHSTSAALSVIH